MVAKKDILIVGGYGTVGRRIAADLAPDYPSHIIVAGRSLKGATQLAAELGHGVRARQADVDDPTSIEAALEDVGVVVSCIDQREPHLLHAAIAHGLAYTDITPHLMQRRLTQAMKVGAARTGARILLGAGLAPGISNMLARLGADRVGAVESVVSNTLLSVGDIYGPASRNYIMEEIASHTPPLWTASSSQLVPSSGLPACHSHRRSVGARRIYFPSPINSSSQKR